MCTRHFGPNGEQSELSLAALKLLRAYRRFDIEAIAGLRQPAAVEAEVESALRRFLRSNGRHVALIAAGSDRTAAEQLFAAGQPLEWEFQPFEVPEIDARVRSHCPTRAGADFAQRWPLARRLVWRRRARGQ